MTINEVNTTLKSHYYNWFYFILRGPCYSEIVGLGLGLHTCNHALCFCYYNSNVQQGHLKINCYLIIECL